MSGQLRKPVFNKVKELVNSRSGYNVIVKVVSVEKSETKSAQPIIRAVVADETGSANAFFKGETVALIQEGKVIAIRNGTIKLIKNHISLQIDMFGRVTAQTVDVKANTENNISATEIERRPRRNNGEERRPRREGEERRHRRQGQERRPRREGDNEERRPRRQQGEQRPRRQGDDRRPRREQGEQRPRRDNEERRPRREEGEQRPRREGDDRRPRGDFDRRPRQQGEDRRPRREGDDRRPPRTDDNRGDRRPPTTFSKIGSFEPGDESINFFAKILKVEEVGRKARVVLGDETGIVKAFLYKSEHIVKGETIVLFRAEARVNHEHIEVLVMEGGKVDAARRKIEEVKESNDISAKEWVEADE